MALVVDLAVVAPYVHGPGSLSFAFTAAKVWNALPLNIQRIQSPCSLRRDVRYVLFAKYEAYSGNTSICFG